MKKNDSLDKAVDTLKNLPVPQGPSSDLVDSTLAEVKAVYQSEPVDQGLTRIPWYTYGKMAVAAAVLMMAAFLVGRRSQPPELSAEQLQALTASLQNSLEPTLTAHVQNQLKNDWQRDLVFAYGKLIREVDQQVDQKLNQHSLQVLAVSQTKTAEALEEVIEAINQNEAYQQASVVDALTRLDKNQTQFAEWTVNSLKRTADWISHVSLDQESNSDPNSMNQFHKYD